MIKLNKCRTLYEFNEKTLAAMNSQTQQTSEAQPEESKTQDTISNNNEKAPESQNIDNKKAPKEEKEHKGNKKDSAEEKDNKTTKESNENEQKENKKDEKVQDAGQGASESQNNESQAQSQYLFFGPDEFIITTYQYENGWWFGYKDTEEGIENKKTGYFPSNYVQVIEEFSQENPLVGEMENLKQNANMDEAFTWNDYAKYSYLDDSQILVEERMKKLNDPRAPENRNPDGILGYKKIKIHESRSHAVNPWKGGKVQSAQIAIKDQSQVSKAYRQMNHYFDYDSWIEERNANPVQKAKADPTKKKKKKKTLDW